MKTELTSAFSPQPSACVLLVLVALCLTALPARAQDTVTLSAAEFQRLVYSAHLHTQLAGKPELEAGLKVLLELQRRNPAAAPAALAGLSRQALDRYRTNAPAYIRTNGARDEILAAYLDALRQVPAHTNFIPAQLSLLNFLVTRAQSSTDEPQADLIHSGSQGLLGSEGDLAQRQALLGACTLRAQGNASFRAAVDALLWSETLVSLSDTSAEIITNTNSPLHGNPTMQTLLALSVASGDGRLTISSNALMTLFSGETQTFWDTIHTNLALQREITRSQSDLLAYLTNQSAIDADAQRLAEVKQGQSRKIASATAAILVQSKLMEARDPLIKLPGQMRGCAEGLHKITDGLAAFAEKDATKLAKAAATGNMLGGAMEIFNLFFGGESPEEEIAREIGNIKTLLGDLSTNMNYRFDRVDQSLTTIFNTLNEQMDKIVIIDGKIAHLNGSVDEIRSSLVDVQTDLFRIERNLATFHALDWRFNLLEDMNLALGYEARVGTTMAYDLYVPSYVGMENVFYTHAYNRAASETLSRYTTLPFGDQYFYSQLSPGGATNVYAETLNYLKKCLRQRLGLAGFPEAPVLANPQDWSAGAAAWLQLAVENPHHFRRYQRDVGCPSRLDGIISKGRDLTNYFRSLVFSGGGTNINWPLYDALDNFYVGKLNTFISLVRAQEQQYANDHDVPALENWRHWAAAVPCVTASATTVLESRVAAPVVPLEFIPPGSPVRAGIVALGEGNSTSHGLALQTGGAVTAWGDNNYGQSTVPAGLSNVIAVAAGENHSLALREDGSVVAWGDSYYGQGSTPLMASNVAAIGTGKGHNLAVRADGQVVGWGYNAYGQATGVPTTSWPYGSTGLVQVAGQAITNAVAAGGGYYYSLVLKTDGQVVLVGGLYGETNVPAGLSDVRAIAAGGFHCLALRSNGTVVAWGENSAGQTNVPPGLDNVVAVAAGSHHSLALLTNGTVVAWGENGSGQTNVPAGLSNVIAIAAGYHNSLALRSDGTLVVWGYNNWLWTRPIRVPVGLSNVVAIAAGSDPTGVALQADGRVVSWHDNYAIPGDLAGVMAISAGQTHRLALKTNGTVVAWGWNGYGECNIPGDLSSAVAVAAGSYAHSLALQADGRVRAWGYNNWKQRDVPSWLSNVVAIAAGNYFNLALRADGTVVGWGLNNEGQATGVPTPSYPFSSSGVVTLSGQPLTNVVAISAGGHSLALLANGTVRAWGNNSAGQCVVPPGLSDVVAIAAGYAHSLALRVDGSVVAWGNNDHGECNVPAPDIPVVALAVGWQQSLFLTISDAGDPAAPQVLRFVRSPVPTRLRPHLVGVNESVLTYMDPSLPPAGTAELYGAKALLEAVVSLALPYTLERDDVLRGFLYGSEPLMELATARTFLQAENARLHATPDAPPRLLTEMAGLRYLRFSERLTDRLNDLQATGQPEIPRVVGHTLRLLNLLRDAWATVPPPALEMGSESNAPRLLLFGEPYTRYTLQYRDSLSSSVWTTTTTTNWRNEQIIAPPVSGSPQRFYRGLLPVP